MKNGLSSELNSSIVGKDFRKLKNKDRDSKFVCDFETKPTWLVIIGLLSYALMIAFGYLRDFMRKIGLESNSKRIEKNRKDFVPLYSNFESFYTRNMYRRFCFAWNIPIASKPGAKVTVLERVSDDCNLTFRLTGKKIEAVNMGSYNYLGFAENSGERNESVKKAIETFGIGVASTRHELGTTNAHYKLEKLLAKFLQVDDCIVVGMGFATNSTTIPNLIGKRCLILSDQFNHASLVLGCRLSGATIRVFKHNDMNDLEKKLRELTVSGDPRTGRPWKKILIVVEGIYSMEGTIVNLPEIIRLKKKYKAYLYLDEAHSIGAIGPNGRGVVDYYGCDPEDVDILMGTFTKSFSAAGGYIAGSKQLIDFVRIHSHSFGYATSMAPPIAQQITSVLKVIMEEEEGKLRISRLENNTIYFRQKLKERGFAIRGDDHSPVVPLMIFVIGKLPAFIMQALRRGVAIVGVGFPASPLLEERIRFCLSASHTKEMLDETLKIVDEIGELFRLKYFKANALK